MSVWRAGPARQRHNAVVGIESSGHAKEGMRVRLGWAELKVIAREASLSFFIQISIPFLFPFQISN